ncbi:Tetratricopeptide TPR_2 repeat protein, partial [mine drainage metagenome]
TDMVAGEDFFLSHRIFVAYDQRKLYFTYSGGPVFDLGLPSSDWRHARAAAKARPHASVKAAADARGGIRYGQCGLAYAAQHEFRHALADLGRACRLEPRNAKCLYRLGTVFWQDSQPAAALRDFSAAIRLNPNDLKAHLARAQLQVARKDWPNPAAKAAAFTEVKADLDTVERLLPPESDVRLALSGLYDDIG